LGLIEENMKLCHISQLSCTRSERSGISRRSRRQVQKFRKLLEVKGFRMSYFDIFTFISDLDQMD
jgi:hypothetical protein